VLARYNPSHQWRLNQSKQLLTIITSPLYTLGWLQTS